MVKTKVGYLVGAFLCSLVSTVVLAVSLATQSWITSKPTTDTYTLDVNYGLFTGSYTTKGIGLTNKFDIYMTCLFDKNICALSCLQTAKERKDQVEKLSNNEVVTTSCDSVGKKSLSERNFKKIKSSVKVWTKENSTVKTGFVNAGLWLTTIIFLAISALFSLVANIFTFINVCTNPIDTYVGTLGLYIWFGISGGTDLLAILLWTSEFYAYITNNVGLVDTINNSGVKSEGLSSLGYSFYLLIVPLLANVAGCGLVFMRQYLLNKKEEDMVIKVDQNKDVNQLLY